VGSRDDYASTLAGIGQGADSLLTPGGIVVAEHSRKTPLDECYGALRRYRMLEQGRRGLELLLQVASRGARRS